MRNAIITVILAACVGTGSAGAREFEDKFGRIIDAELVSHKGKASGKVKIKTKGKEHVVSISKFSEKDQKFIKEWVAKTPASINYKFTIEADKTKQSSVKMRGYYYNTGKSDMYVYEVKVTNSSTETVGNLTVKYQAVMRDKVGNSGSYYSTYYGQGLKVIEDTIAVKGPLKYNQSASFVTKPFQIDSARYGGYYSTSSKFKDSILGCRVRVFDAAGNLLEDYRTRNTKFAKLNLDDPDEGTEVIIE